jgi:hypothetical protein
VTLPGWVDVREPRGRLGGRYTKNVTICPTQACTKPLRESNNLQKRINSGIYTISIPYVPLSNNQSN